MDKRWERRLRSGKNAQLGRISQISPKTSELFYLRLLLIYRTAPKSFEHLRTISGVLHGCHEVGYGYTGRRPLLGETHRRCRTLAEYKQIEATFRRYLTALRTTTTR